MAGGGAVAFMTLAHVVQIDRHRGSEKQFDLITDYHSYSALAPYSDIYDRDALY